MRLRRATVLVCWGETAKQTTSNDALQEIWVAREKGGLELLVTDNIS